VIGLRSDDIKAVMHRYHVQLTAHREALNGLNVYPVPDGDTGTNMSLTVASMLQPLEAAVSMADVSEVIAQASLMGARGNSGVILSQILRGFSDTFRERDVVGIADLVDALDRASAAAYRAVQRPVEGTILTVLREAAEAAGDGSEPAETLATLLRRVYDRGVEALERTPEMLPILKQAGVVDAGGAGLLLLLASFLEVVTGIDVELPERVLAARANLGAIHQTEDGVAALRYEVMFMLDADEESVDEFRARWSELGDSIVVVGGDGTWSCHIHTDLIGPSIEAAIAAGTPSSIRVTDLLEEAGDHAMHRTEAFQPLPEVTSAGVGVVAVVAGDGLVEVFRQLGAQGIVTGGQTMNPSTEDLLAVVESIPSPKVLVLPNNKNIVPVAEQLDTLTTKSVAVVPTRSVAQGIAAMIGYNPLEDDAGVLMEDMAAAASSVVTGEVTRAVRDAHVEFGRINHGDWLGIADGTIVVADTDIETVLRGLVAALLMPGVELLTVYTGDDAASSALKALEAWLGEIRPEIEISEVHGGQSLYPYLISLE
jgi:uncharacterized protein